MKLVLLPLLCSLASTIAWAQKSVPDSLPVTIHLKNKRVIVDSVYIIFDRYDRTGAGVIKKKFYPSDNKVVIEKVPKGKYFVDIYCIGIDQQNHTKVSMIGKRRTNKVTVPLEYFETYIPGTAIIPPSIIDVNNLIVTQKKSQAIRLKIFEK